MQPLPVLTAAAVLLSVVLACAVAADDEEAPGAPTPAGNAVRLPWHIYRHFPADFSRWREAAASFRGWESEVRDLDLRRTALVLMHLPDCGLTAQTEWGPDSASPNSLGTVEWVPRTMDVVSFRLPGLVAAARQAGLQVIHVWGGPGTGPVWERSLREVGDPPPADPDAIARDEQRRAQHMRDVFDLPRSDEPAIKTDAPDLLSPAARTVLEPREGDLCAAYSWQLHRLCKARGIDHLVYCGWALNWCLWFSPGGMCDMDRKGYLCSAVRGGCVAIENAESAVGELNLEYAYWKTCTMFGYVFDLHELTGALRRHAAPAAAGAPAGGETD